jgi:hypothetical protein
MDQGEAMNLKKNLINNSVIRGGKITTIAINYKDWYEGFKKNSLDYQGKLQKVIDDENKRKATFERKDANDMKNDTNKVLDENIFDFSDDIDVLGLDELALPKDDRIEAKTEDVKENVEAKAVDVEAKIDNTLKAVENKALETKENVEAKAKELVEIVETKEEAIKESVETKANELEVKAETKAEDVKEKVEAKANDVQAKVEEKAKELENKTKEAPVLPVIEMPDAGVISLDI